MNARVVSADASESSCGPEAVFTGATESVRALAVSMAVTTESGDMVTVPESLLDEQADVKSRVAAARNKAEFRMAKSCWNW